MKTNKGQTVLTEAPNVVLIVGFVFLLMATFALTNSKFRSGLNNDLNATVNNETTLALNLTNPLYQLSRANKVCDAAQFTIIGITNSSGSLFGSGNYTVNYNTGILNGSTATAPYNGTSWNITYSYYYPSGLACNITQDFDSEVKNNTSIAGIILTITLVSIVLGVLIGSFAFKKQQFA